MGGWSPVVPVAQHRKLWGWDPRVPQRFPRPPSEAEHVAQCLGGVPCPVAADVATRVYPETGKCSIALHREWGWRRSARGRRGRPHAGCGRGLTRASVILRGAQAGAYSCGVTRALLRGVAPSRRALRRALARPAPRAQWLHSDAIFSVRVKPHSDRRPARN